MSILSMTAVLSVFVLGQQPEVDDPPWPCSTEVFSLPLRAEEAERNKYSSFKLYLSTDRGKS